MKKITVMGIGNYIFCDEGIGIHAIKELEKMTFPENVKIIDVGTACIFTNDYVSDADIIIAIDAIASDKKPGTIIVYDAEDILLSRVPMKISPHQIGFQETLLHAQLRGDLPSVVKLVGVVPESLETVIGLSEPCKKALPIVIDKVVDLINEYTEIHS